jgi:transposase
MNVRATLTTLRDLYRRVDELGLDAGERSIIRALLSKEIGRCERRLAKMLAKLADEAEAEEGEAPGPIIDAECSVVGAQEDDDGDPGHTGHIGDDGCVARDGSAAGSQGPAASTPAEPESKGQGHGRNGAGAYANAKHCLHALLAGVIGAVCEACGVGRMSRYREKLIVVIKGQPLFDAAVHHFEQVRCRLCGAIVTAEGVAALTAGGIGSSYITYDWSACALLLVMHYFAGLPYKRIESLHAGWGVPMPDANQWTIANASADLLFPLYKALERHGIQNALALRIDDTGSMIIEVRQKIRAEIAALERLGESTTKVRTGINATGVYLETDQGKVLLFLTGRHHASEIIDQLLLFRRGAQNKEKLVKVSDAASKNFTHAHGDELEEAVCNAHAFLKFRAIKDQHPEAYGLAGEVYKKVFANDDEAKAKGLNPQERMLHHRAHSLPQMKRLKKMCREKLEGKLVEPNSPLWEPITFIINQWDRLTRFCEVPGVPLDTNVVEQMLIIPVRYLAGSFNYKTQNGADVGDRHMSLIATANANGVEPVAYLTECLENHEDLARRPEYYLPWVYRARLEALDESKRRSGPSNPHSTAQPVQHPLRPGAHRAHPPGTIEPAAGPPSSAEREEAEAEPGRTRRYATFLHSAGKAQDEGSPPQIRT